MKMARVLSIGDLPFHGVFRLCMCESSGFFCNGRVAPTNLDKSDADPLDSSAMIVLRPLISINQTFTHNNLRLKVHGMHMDNSSIGINAQLSSYA